MANRICTRCGKQFRYPSDLRQHAARKTPCELILNPEDLPEVYEKEKLEDPLIRIKSCKFCGRVFSSYDAMRRHVRETCRIAPNKRNGEDGMELLYEHTLKRQVNRLEKDLAEQKTQNGEMLTLMRQLTGQGAGSGPGSAAATGDGAHATVNNGTVNNNQQTNNIHINFFGQESTAHITREVIEDILREASKYSPAEGSRQVVMNTAQRVWCDPEHPENSTCFLRNQREGSAMVHQAEGWIIRPVESILPSMVERSVNEAFDKQPIEGVDEEDLQRYGEVLKELVKVEQDPEKMRQLAGPNGSMKVILSSNKEQLSQRLGRTPRLGELMRQADPDEASDEGEGQLEGP